MSGLLHMGSVNKTYRDHMFSIQCGSAPCLVQYSDFAGVAALITPLQTDLFLLAGHQCLRHVLQSSSNFEAALARSV